MRSDLPTVVDRFAAFAVAKVRKGGLLFGRAYVRLGPLFSVAGWWLFQTGGAFGYGLRGHPAILGKLLGVPAEDAVSYVQDVLLNLASWQLIQASDKDKSFFQLYLVPTLAEQGIHLDDLNAARKWGSSKVYDQQAIFDFMQATFQKGTAVGFHFAEEFRTYWDWTFRQRPEPEWAEMHKRGIVSKPEQQALRLQDEVSVALRAAADWVRERAPAQIRPHDLATVDELAARP